MHLHKAVFLTAGTDPHDILCLEVLGCIASSVKCFHFRLTHCMYHSGFTIQTLKASN